MSISSLKECKQALANYSAFVTRSKETAVKKRHADHTHEDLLALLSEAKIWLENTLNSENSQQAAELEILQKIKIALALNQFQTDIQPHTDPTAEYDKTRFQLMNAALEPEHSEMLHSLTPKLQDLMNHILRAMDNAVGIAPGDDGFRSTQIFAKYFQIYTNLQDDVETLKTRLEEPVLEKFLSQIYDPEQPFFQTPAEFVNVGEKLFEEPIDAERKKEIERWVEKLKEAETAMAQVLADANEELNQANPYELTSQAEQLLEKFADDIEMFDDYISSMEEHLKS